MVHMAARLPVNQSDTGVEKQKLALTDCIGQDSRKTKSVWWMACDIWVKTTSGFFFSLGYGT